MIATNTPTPAIVAASTTGDWVLNLTIERGAGGWFYVTCEQHRGVLICRPTLSAALASVVPALQDLLAAGPSHPDPHAFDGVTIE